MKYIDSEIILQRKISPLVYVYSLIIIVIVLSLIILFILCYYKTYYTIRGVVIKEEENCYIRIYLPIEDIKYIVNNNVVTIDNIKYKYSINEIDSQYFTDNIITYQVVKINVDIKTEYKINNLTLNLKFIKDNKRIIDYIIK